MILDCEMRKSASFEASLGTFMAEFRPIGAQYSDEEDWLHNSKARLFQEYHDSSSSSTELV